MDACPGRLNQVSVYIKRTGFFYGQCSELCGVSHGFMPIAITVVDYDLYCTTLRLLLAGLPSKEGLSQAEKLAQWQDAIVKIKER
jgi:heme/copper-type cytochrome/quinol oxidase subunit 2